MMVDFGARVERKELIGNLDKSNSEIIQKLPSNDLHEVTEKMKHHADLLQLTLNSNDPTGNRMNSIQNELFRKIREQAMRD